MFVVGEWIWLGWELFWPYFWGNVFEGRSRPFSQLFLRSLHRMSTGSDVLGTGKTGCYCWYWGCEMSGSRSRSENQSLYSERRSCAFLVSRRFSCSGKGRTFLRSRRWIWQRDWSSAQSRWNPEAGCSSLRLRQCRYRRRPQAPVSCTVAVMCARSVPWKGKSS